MQKTPSYLKGLAETRARVSAEVTRLDALIGEIEKRRDTARAEMDACDRLIRKFDARLVPEDIRPIRAWKGRYGPRGVFRESVLALVASEYPNPVSTTEIGAVLQLKYELDFATSAERKAWMNNSVGNALRWLASVQRIVPCHDQSLVGGSGQTGMWVLAQPLESLEALSQLAQVAHVPCIAGPDEPLCDEEPEEDDLPR